MIVDKYKRVDCLLFVPKKKLYKEHGQEGKEINVTISL